MNSIVKAQKEIDDIQKKAPLSSNFPDIYDVITEMMTNIEGSSVLNEYFSINTLYEAQGGKGFGSKLLKFVGNTLKVTFLLGVGVVVGGLFAMILNNAFRSMNIYKIRNAFDKLLIASTFGRQKNVKTLLKKHKNITDMFTDQNVYIELMNGISNNELNKKEYSKIQGSLLDVMNKEIKMYKTSLLNVYCKIFGNIERDEGGVSLDNNLLKNIPLPNNSYPNLIKWKDPDDVICYYNSKLLDDKNFDPIRVKVNKRVLWWYYVNLSLIAYSTKYKGTKTQQRAITLLNIVENMNRSIDLKGTFVKAIKNVVNR